MSHPLLTYAALCALFLAPVAIHAQEGKVRVKVKADLAAAPDRELGLSKTAYGDPGSFVALKTLGGQMALGGLTEAQLGWQLSVIANDKMGEIKRDKPKFVWGIGPVAIETIETFQKQFRVILSKPDPENGQLLLLQQELSPRSLTGRAASLITEVPYALFGKTNDYFTPGTTVGFNTTLSANGQFMLLGLSPATTTRSAGSPIVAVMLGKNMQPKWMNSLQKEAGNATTEVATTAVDNKGNAWYLIKNVGDNDPKTKEVVGYSFSIYRLDSTGQQVFPLELGQKDHAQEALLAIAADGTVVCTGIYSNPEANRNESVGIFHASLNVADGTWKVQGKHPFNLQEVKKTQRLQTNMHIEQVWPKSNGGWHVVAERAGVETHQVSDLSGKKVEKTEWVNGAFHVMELDAAGGQVWYTEVPREMSYAKSGPGKAFSIAHADQLFIFYNDDARNMDLRKKKQPVDPVDKPKDALMLEFKADGGYKERAVLQEGTRSGYFDADAVWPMGEGLFGLEGAPDFRKDRTFPILIEMTDGSRR